MSEMKWSVQGYKEYCKLSHRNYVLDDLYGDELEASADFLKWQEMGKTYGPGVSNSDLMIAAYEDLQSKLAASEARVRELELKNKLWIEQFIVETRFQLELLNSLTSLPKSDQSQERIMELKRRLEKTEVIK